MAILRDFRSNDWPSLGVEIELQLVDARTMALKSAFGAVHDGVPPGRRDVVRPEFMQCYVELNTGVCSTVADVGRDLEGTIRCVERAAADCGVRLAWGATHPFSSWLDQRISPDERYHDLANRLGETVIRPVTFGLHVHVGVDSGDKAIRIMSRLRPYLPVLLALSANSPFWNGRATGQHAHRVELLEGFPTGGIPPALDSWDAFVDLAETMRRAGFIESPHELWWDVRPNPEHGTVEVRICDMPADLASVLGLTALTQCLVTRLSREIDEGQPAPPCPEIMLRQNRWRAYRFGLDAMLVEPATLEARSVPAAVERLATTLRSVAEDLGCERELDSVRDMAARPTGSQAQIADYERTGSLVDVTRGLVKRGDLGGGVEEPYSLASGYASPSRTDARFPAARPGPLFTRMLGVSWRP